VGAELGLLIYAYYNSEGHSDFVIKKGKLDTVSSAYSSFETHEIKIPLERTSLFPTFQPPQTPEWADFPSKSPGALSAAEEYGDILVFRLPGDLTYLNSAAAVQRAKTIAHKTDYKYIVISLRYLYYLDADGIDSLGEIMHEFEGHAERLILIAGPQPSILPILRLSKWYTDKEEHHLVFQSHKEAVKWLEDRDEQHKAKMNLIMQHASSFRSESTPAYRQTEGYFDLSPDSSPASSSSSHHSDV